MPRKRRYARALDVRHGLIDMNHGSGGRATAQLIEELFVRAFNNEWLRRMDDQAHMALPPGKIVIATDGHVISPLFFPGGDIGSLSVHGTINDVAMAGAVPLYLTVGFILEEGFPLSDLKKIVDSMAAAAQAAQVRIVAGDTKVVERGKGDGIFITTTGVGVVDEALNIHADQARVGDCVLVSGTIGDHGVAIMSLREHLTFDTDLVSDTAALHGLVAHMVRAAPDIHCLRDPTRGGLATTLNEIADLSCVGIRIWESAVPIRSEVKAACELLGLDPLYIANEGKLVAICPRERSQDLLEAMRAHPLGADAAIIGEVVEDPHSFVEMETAFGGRRVVDWLMGDPLPRIC
ncbi:MAG: hydrogenase expression/formation protein HypE [Acidiferrobacter sp.]